MLPTAEVSIVLDDTMVSGSGTSVLGSEKFLNPHREHLGVRSCAVQGGKKGPRDCLRSGPSSVALRTITAS